MAGTNINIIWIDVFKVFHAEIIVIMIEKYISEYKKDEHFLVDKKMWIIKNVQFYWTDLFCKELIYI